MHKYLKVNKITFITLINILVLIFPLSLLRHEMTGLLVITLMSFMGLVILYIKKDNICKIKFIQFIFFIFFPSFILIFLVHINIDTGIQFNTLNLALYQSLLCPLVAYCIYNANLSHKIFITGIKVSLILVGLWIIYHNIQADYPRILWSSRFGALLLAFTFIEAKNSKEDKFDIFLSFLSLIVATNSIILSGDRLTFLTLIPLLILIFTINRIYLTRVDQIKKNYIYLFLTFLIIFISFQGNQTMKERLTEVNLNLVETLIEKEAYEPQALHNSSILQRGILFKSGFKSIKEKPLFGHGFDNVHTELTKHYPIEYNDHPFLLRITHAHNSFINITIASGFFGLLILIGNYFLIPLVLFIKYLKIKKRESLYASLGIILLTGYGFLSTGETMYLGIAETSFFVFFISYCLANIYKK